VEADPRARALDFYDQALKAAASIRGLQFPEATYVGKAEPLVKLNRFAEAEELLHASLVSDTCRRRAAHLSASTRRTNSALSAGDPRYLSRTTNCQYSLAAGASGTSSPSW